MSERVNEQPNGAGVGGSFGAGVAGSFGAQGGNSLTVASLEIKVEKQWSLALKYRNCKQLIDLLDKHPHLWLKTDADNRNVLHAAVIQGCVKLTKLVVNGTPYSKQLPVEKRNRQEFRKILELLLKAKDGNCRADTFTLAAIVGNEEMIQVLESATKSRSAHGGASSQSTHDGIIESSKPDASDTESGHLPPCDDYCDDSAIFELFYDLPRTDGFQERDVHDSALQEQIERDVDYNFADPKKKFLFHFACKKVHSNIDFIRRVVAKAKAKVNEKPGLLQKLFNQMDAQGRMPLHVAVDYCRGAELWGIQELLDIMRDESCDINGRDGAGRTTLLRATANGMSLESSKVVKILADDPRTDLNEEWPGTSGATALHVAVLHGHGASARYLLEAPRDKPGKLADYERHMSRRIKAKFEWYLTWTPLELAAVMGRHSVLVNMLQFCAKSNRPIYDQHCLHLAAAAGNPQSIQALLMNRNDNLRHFENNKSFGGYSSLHFAVNATLPHQPFHSAQPPSVKAIDEKFDRFLAFSDFASVFWLERELTAAASQGPQQAKLGMPVIGYGSKKTCATLLFQAGVDIWPSAITLKTPVLPISQDMFDAEEDSTKGGLDFHSKIHLNWDPGMPDPGNNASDDARIWWYESVAKDTLEVKSSFNAAGNATAVVATLVATASFIGPLTPPLGYGSDTWTTDRVQMTSLAVRVFMVSNSLSFYLAIASIMLAIMPSLPMPQEGLREELRRSRRTVALSISVLLISMLGLLVSFTSCLIAVMPKDHYWGYTFYPAFVGGIICFVVLFLFFLRLLRLVFNRNAKIRNFYHLFGVL